MLQDIHWAGGGIGYFSAYLIGNVISAQAWEQVERDIPNISDQFRPASSARCAAWQKQHLHRFGSKYSPRATTEKFLSGPLSHEPYVRIWRPGQRVLRIGWKGRNMRFGVSRRRGGAGTCARSPIRSSSLRR